MPKVAGAGWSFQKFNRRAQDWAIVGVAVVRHGDGAGRRPGQHGRHARCGPLPSRPRWRPGRPTPRPPLWPPTAPSRRRPQRQRRVPPPPGPGPRRTRPGRGRHPLTRSVACWPGSEARGRSLRAVDVGTVDEVREALGGAGLPGRRGAGHVGLPRPAAAAPAAARGRGRRGQDRGGQGPGRLDRRRAHPAPVLRGPRRRPGRLRVGPRPPAPAPAGGRGGRHRRRAGHRRARGRALHRALPRAPGRCSGPSPRRRVPAAGAAHRRDRPGRRRVRGLPPRGAGRLRHHRPRARHVPRRGAAARRHHLEPHPRRARRPEAPLPLPLGRAPRLRAGGGHRPAPGPAGGRAAGPPGGGRRRGPAGPGPLQAAGRGRDDRLGRGPGHPRPHRRSTRRRWRPPSAPSSSTARTRSGCAARASPGW